MKFERVWVPISLWEELDHNMWGSAVNRKDMARKALIFTANHRLYGKYMRRVTNEWPNSCINALTDYNLNRKAWIGHAACALALRCPEDITRQAWGLLTNEQRTLANNEADRAIQAWEMRYRKSLGISAALEKKMLHRRDTRRSANKSYAKRTSAFMEGSGNLFTAK